MVHRLTGTMFQTLGLCTLMCYLSTTTVVANDVLGCGGFLKSHVPIDFSKVIIKLYTKQGLLKEQTHGAPNNGYYFIPIYDKGEYQLQVEPPLGWTFTPTRVPVHIDGTTDQCSLGQDINFVFQGFGVAGRVESYGANSAGGPAGVTVSLLQPAAADTGASTAAAPRTTVTADDGMFFFTLVYPGDYVIEIAHATWKIRKGSMKLRVTEGDTQLPKGSLIVAGYDVKGIAKSQGTPVGGVKMLLYSEKDSNVLVEGCDQSEVMKSSIQGHKYLCHVTSSVDGKFTFPAVSSGSYQLVPFFKGDHIYFQPQTMPIIVSHTTVTINEPFEITGFSIQGRVLDGAAGRGLSGAKVLLDGAQIAITDARGGYQLNKIKAAGYDILITYDNVKFESVHVKLNENTERVPDIVPSQYRVCGHVSSEQAQTVVVTRADTTHGDSKPFLIHSEAETGTFCEYLSPGEYHFEVNGIKQGIQFYPKVHKVTVGANHVDISFTQLKATVTGTVKCFTYEDCKDIQITLHPVDDDDEKDHLQGIRDGKYVFTEVRPGKYLAFLSSSRFSFNVDQHLISVSSFELTVPPFVQTGYAVTFIASHHLNIRIKAQTKVDSAEAKTTQLELNGGPSRHVLGSPGVYTITPIADCHSYDPAELIYDTSATATSGNELHITARTHRLVAHIDTDGKDYGPIKVNVTIDGAPQPVRLVKFVSKPGHEGQYDIQFQLSSGQTVHLVPQSDELFFTPPIVLLTAEDDCKDAGDVVSARMGRVFTGRVLPALADVEIKLTEGETGDSWTERTDEKGRYRFAPVDASTGQYSVSAEKESYILEGPDNNGDFHMHKLAEVLVQVVDITTGLPLQGTLLSLSGGESYRRNLQTDEQGRVDFFGLGPSEYFLRPVMKEYSFEPASKIIKVEEGVTVNVKLMGRRVAFSAFGRVTSLNGEPESGVNVIATGRGNCSKHSELTTSEPSGNFRVRGLLPHCAYAIAVHRDKSASTTVTMENSGATDGSSAEDTPDETETARTDEDEADMVAAATGIHHVRKLQPIERSVPAEIETVITTEDVRELRLLIIRSAATTDLLVQVHTPNPDHYRTITLRVLRSHNIASSSGEIHHSTRLDAHHTGLGATGSPNSVWRPHTTSFMLVHVPAVPLDRRQYTVQIESPLLGTASSSFLAVSAFQHLKLSLAVPTADDATTNTSGDPQQQPAQVRVGSMLAIVALACCCAAVYHQERLAQFAHTHLTGGALDVTTVLGRLAGGNSTAGGGGGVSGRGVGGGPGGASAGGGDKDYAEADIDQLVLTINATGANNRRRAKPKRI